MGKECSYDKLLTMQTWTYFLYNGHSYAKSYFLDVTHILWLRQSNLFYNEYTCVKTLLKSFIKFTTTWGIS